MKIRTALITFLLPFCLLLTSCTTPAAARPKGPPLQVTGWASETVLIYVSKTGEAISVPAMHGKVIVPSLPVISGVELYCFFNPSTGAAWVGPKFDFSVEHHGTITGVFLTPGRIVWWESVTPKAKRMDQLQAYFETHVTTKAWLTYTNERTPDDQPLPTNHLLKYLPGDFFSGYYSQADVRFKSITTLTENEIAFDLFAPLTKRTARVKINLADKSIVSVTEIK